MRIRQATYDDIRWITEELKLFAKFLGTERVLFPSDEYAEEKLKMLIDEHVFIMAEWGTADQEYLPVGFIAGICSPHFFNPEIRVLTELFWWVKLAWRGSRAGALLFNEFMNAAEERADMVVMTLESKSPVKPETLERRGFVLYEQNFVLEVK